MIVSISNGMLETVSKIIAKYLELLKSLEKKPFFSQVNDTGNTGDEKT